MKMRLTLETLKDLDLGKVNAAFDRELAHVVKDCIDRPDDRTARTVSLELAVTPEAEGGVCEVVNGEFTIKSKVPPRRSRRYEMAVKPTGVALINPESPDAVRQMTLDEKA